MKGFYDPAYGLPSDPLPGDTWASTNTANGWTAHHLYRYGGATWEDLTPSGPADGDVIWSVAHSLDYYFFGSTWQEHYQSIPGSAASGNLPIFDVGRKLIDSGVSLSALSDSNFRIYGSALQMLVQNGTDSAIPSGIVLQQRKHVISGTDQLSQLRLAGVYISNSDNLRLYGKIYDESGTRHVEFYRDADRQYQVASGVTTGDGGIHMASAWGIECDLAVVYTGDDSDWTIDYASERMVQPWVNEANPGPFLGVSAETIYPGTWGWAVVKGPATVTLDLDASVTIGQMLTTIDGGSGKVAYQAQAPSNCAWVGAAIQERPETGSRAVKVIVP